MYYSEELCEELAMTSMPLRDNNSQTVMCLASKHVPRHACDNSNHVEAWFFAKNVKAGAQVLRPIKYAPSNRGIRL